MQLVTNEVRAALPALYSDERTPVGDKVVPVKFFYPAGAWTFYALEFDGEDTFFGWIAGVDFPELGYVSLAEMQALHGAYSMGIERDLYWRPKPLREVPGWPS